MRIEVQKGNIYTTTTMELRFENRLESKTDDESKYIDFYYGFLYLVTNTYHDETFEESAEEVKIGSVDWYVVNAKRAEIDGADISDEADKLNQDIYSFVENIYGAPGYLASLSFDTADKVKLHSVMGIDLLKNPPSGDSLYTFEFSSLIDKCLCDFELSRTENFLLIHDITIDDEHKDSDYALWCYKMLVEHYTGFVRIVGYYDLDNSNLLKIWDDFPDEYVFDNGEKTIAVIY